MNEGEETRQSFSWVRRWSAGLNLIITIAAVVALMAMFNYLSIRHFTRFHWNRTTEADLSERTQQLLRSLTNQIKVTVYWDSKEDMLLPRVKGLLKEYQFASPRIQVQYVDYTRDVAAAEKVKQDYKLPPGKKDAVIFEANGVSAVVNASDLSDYDYSELLSGKGTEIYRTHFKGEVMFTSKIYSVATGRRTVAYYLHENGEHADVGDPSLDGYGKFFAMLRNENNFDIRPLRIVGTNEIPADCQLLIIAGPITPLATTELDRIQGYLEQGGRALIAFNRYSATSRQQTGLEKLLAKWGVEVGENTVIDKENSLSGTGWEIMPVDLGPHAIMNALDGLRVVLSTPRPIRAKLASRAEDFKVDELLLTGPNSFVMDISRNQIDPAQKMGRKSLMAVIEKSVPGLQRGSTRIVVLGDSTVWGNNFLQSDANRQFGAATANWLVSQSVLLSGIPPRALRNYKVMMTQSQLRSVQLILIAGLPGTVLLIGSLVWLRRRH